MANTVTTTLTQDGPRHAVLQIYIESDGTSGDLTDQSVLDISTLAVAQRQTSLKYVSISKAWAEIAGDFTARLEFDATTDQGAINFPQNDSFEHCYKYIGGVRPSDPDAAGFTGDLLLTTDGFTATGNHASITLELKKTYT